MQSKSIGTSPGFPAPPANTRSRVPAGQPAHPAPPVAAESPEKPPVVPGHTNLALGATDPFAGIQDAKEGARRFGAYGDLPRPSNTSPGNPFAHSGIDPTNPFFAADDGFKPRDETKVASGDGHKPIDRNPFTNGEAAVQQQPVNPIDNPFDGAPLVNPPAGKGLNEQAAPPTNHGIQAGDQPAGAAPAHADPAAPAPQAKTAPGHKTVDQVDAERQAVEALDNAVFFKSMQARLARLCGEHGIDLKDVEPLVNLFKDAAATSLIQMAEATEKATGQKLKVDDPLFVNAMKLARAADPLEGDGSEEEGSEGTFELKSGSAPTPASGKALDHSIGLLPKEAQPGIKQAVLKAGDVLASTSQEHASVIDLGALPKKSMLDLDDADHALSDLSEDDGVGSAAPAPKMKPVGKDKSLNLGVDPDVALEELEDLVAASSEESSPVFKDIKLPKVSDIFRGKRVRP